MKNLKKVVGGSFLTITIVVVPCFFYALEAFGQVNSSTIHQEEASRVVGEVTIPYVTALQAGDVHTLEGLIDGNLAITLGTLLRENQEYPNFLREKFGKSHLLDTQFQLEQKVKELFVITGNEQGSGILTVELSQSSGSLVTLQLSLTKDKSGNWKVVDQKVFR